MLRALLSCLLVAAWLPILGAERAAAALPGDRTDAVLCHMATAAAEHETGVPDQLLTAISRVEAGQPDPGTGRMVAWPWTLDVEGVGHVYATKAQAVAAALDFQAQGARSIDVGCMQINLRQHPDAFATLDQALDPMTNARYAAQFLERLFQQTGSWPHAAAAYHSQTPSLGQDYQAQVLRIWADGDGPVAPDPRDAGRHAAPSPHLFTVAATSGGGLGAEGVPSRPVLGGIPVHVQFYGPATSRLPPGSNRGLAAYRRMPIAMETRPLFASGG